MTRPEGLQGRPAYRNLIFASDRDNGYADMPLPGIGEALRDHDAARASHEVLDLAKRVDAAARRVDAARAALTRR
jgi:N-acetylated-alpha-linked acidic dipeptidase